MMTTTTTPPLPLPSIIYKDSTYIQTIARWLRSYRRQNHKAIVLHGPCGIGKTALVTRICTHYNIRLYDVDTSNEDGFQRSLLNVTGKQTSFQNGAMVSQKRALIVHCVDIIRASILRLIKTTPVPLFCIYDGDKLPHAYSKYASTMRMQALSVPQTVALLSCLNTHHKWNRSPRDIDVIARGCAGDIRHAKLTMEYHTHTKDVTNNSKKFANDILNGDPTTHATTFRDVAAACHLDTQLIQNTLVSRYLKHVHTIDDASRIADGFSLGQVFAKYHHSMRSAELEDIVATTWLELALIIRQKKEQKKEKREEAEQKEEAEQ